MDPSYRDHRRGVERRQIVQRLRGQATDAERALWRLIRAGQVSGAKLRRQHELGPYVLDFFCPERSMVVEADGGHHLDADKQVADAERTRYLRGRGLHVLRFTNIEILREPGSVLQVILAALGTPSPSPSPRGRGDAAGRSGGR